MNTKHNDSKSIRLDAASFGLEVLPSEQRVLSAVKGAGVRSKSVVCRNREVLVNRCDVPDYSAIVVAFLVVRDHEQLAQRAAPVFGLAAGNLVISSTSFHATTAAMTESRELVICGQLDEDVVK